MNTDTLNERQAEIWTSFLKQACRYAHQWGRWAEAEEFILKNPECAYNYAKDVIKGRWTEAEKTIIKDPEHSFCYARNVIKGRWPEAEETISKSPDWADLYARNVINGQRSAILELNFLCYTTWCKFSTVQEYVSKIDWTDPANDFEIPKRLNDALKKACVAKQS